jgi:nucleolar protein 58
MNKIVVDNIQYANIIRTMGLRENAANVDLCAILPPSTATELKKAALLSMGAEISIQDLCQLQQFCDLILSLYDYRTLLFDYLKNRMNSIAPNLTVLVGELVGARLIAHSGSLMNLAKHPASTVQILGAEKALFRALKFRKETPKYGIIYNASLVGQCAPKLKGKISRILAAKCSLSIRVDAIGDSTNATIGINGRAKVEARLRQLEETLRTSIINSKSNDSFSNKAATENITYGQLTSKPKTYIEANDLQLTQAIKKKRQT